MRTQGAGNLWRIMTSNVWADVFGNPVEGRDTQLAQVYEHYLPDVLCLQEMHPNWHASRLKPQLAQRYDEVVAEQGDYALNYTPVFYRRDRLRLIGSAFHVFSGPNDFDSKSFTAAVFEPLDGGEAFAVLSTHLYYEDNDFGNRVRVQNVQEIIGFLRTLAPLRAMVCGDCNCRADSAPRCCWRSRGCAVRSGLPKLLRRNPPGMGIRSLIRLSAVLSESRRRSCGRIPLTTSLSRKSG